MIELERTYLPKKLPEGLKKFPHKEIIDIYIPQTVAHPKLRLRKNGEKYEMTKKQRVEQNDASKQKEYTIPLTPEEFGALAKVEGKRVRKWRYMYDDNGSMAEIDIFQDDLDGLVLVDFEFETNEAKDRFIMPEWCLIEVTQEPFAAGGMLCGKRYEDIDKDLEKRGYKKLAFDKMPQIAV